jgi:MinD-like ATPase involved in chromosome partitioning or flagellar assembly
MLRIATALDPEGEHRLIPAIAADGNELVARADGVRELLVALDRHAVAGVIASATRHQLSAEVVERCDDLGVRLVAVAANDVDRRYAASLGLHEVVSGEAEWGEIDRLLRGHASIGSADHAQSRNGTVIAVWGPAGSPGRTTVAIQLAAELAAQGQRVALIDADTYGGTVAPALGLLDESPSFAAACRLAAHDGLTIAELERVGARYTSPRGAFWVLTGIGRAARWPEVGSDRVAKTLSVCRDWVDYVVVDTGFNLESDEEISSDLFAPRRNGATIAALQQADQVVAVGSGDPIGLARFLRAYVELADTVELERVSVIINRVRASAIGVNPQHQVRQTLRRFGGLDDPVIVPSDVTGVDAAVLAGKTLLDAAPRSPVRASLTRFVQSRILPPVDKPLSRREARRLADRTPGRRRRGDNAGG